MTALDELRAAIEELAGSISRAPTGSIGSIDNTYIAQIGVESHARRREAVDVVLARVEAELVARRETNQKLNRRCQSAEKGLAAKLDAVGGASLGRALANAAATMYHEQLAERNAELAALRKRPTLEQVTDALSALDIPYMYRGADVLIRRDVFRAIRALYDRAETGEHPNG